MQALPELMIRALNDLNVSDRMRRQKHLLLETVKYLNPRPN